MRSSRREEASLNTSNQVHEWWTKALLGEQLSAHPIFGRSIHVDVDGGIVTLTGYVETAEEAQDIEREAEALQSVRAVVNHLKVIGPEEPQHLQTIVAVFPDGEAARLGCQDVAAAWQSHEGHEARVVEDRDEAAQLLNDRALKAHVPADAVKRYLRAVDEGKVLLVDRLPEDDALRVLSVLEGTRAELVKTLPPEPDSTG